MLKKVASCLYWGRFSTKITIPCVSALTHWPLGDLNKILEKIIFKLILVTDGCDISSEIALRWTSLELSDDESTLVQVMAWCHQATSHYLNQCWPISLPPYGVTGPQWVNSLASGRYGNKFKSVIFKLVTQNSSLGTCCSIALRCMPQNLTNEKSAVVQVIDCCLMAPSPYLSQCWPRSMSPYGITRPQWVDIHCSKIQSWDCHLLQWNLCYHYHVEIGWWWI